MKTVSIPPICFFLFGAVASRDGGFRAERPRDPACRGRPRRPHRRHPRRFHSSTGSGRDRSHAWRRSGGGSSARRDLFSRLASLSFGTASRCPLDRDLVLGDGTRVAPDGTITSPDGRVVSVPRGHMLSMDGRLIPAPLAPELPGSISGLGPATGIISSEPARGTVSSGPATGTPSSGPATGASFDRFRRNWGRFLPDRQRAMGRPARHVAVRRRDLLRGRLRPARPRERSRPVPPAAPAGKAAHHQTDVNRRRPRRAIAAAGIERARNSHPSPDAVCFRRRNKM